MNLPIAPIAGAVIGIAVAAGVAVLPTDLLEGLVMDSGLPAIFAMAEPPLGVTARIALALASGGLVGTLSWFALFVLIGTRGLVAEKTPLPLFDHDDELVAPVLRRADAHPDAPPRPPLLATRDLGTPFLEIRAEAAPKPITAPEPESKPEPEPEPELKAEPVIALAQPPKEQPPVEQPLPQDLNQPLAAFDPGALLEEPLPAPMPLPPLKRPVRPPVYEDHERFETFQLKPPVPAPRRQPTPAPAPQPAPGRSEASVHALLDRLEKGMGTHRTTAARPAPAPRAAERGLEEALATLRNLARSA